MQLLLGRTKLDDSLALAVLLLLRAEHAQIEPRDKFLVKRWQPWLGLLCWLDGHLFYYFFGLHHHAVFFLGESLPLPGLRFALVLER